MNLINIIIGFLKWDVALESLFILWCITSRNYELRDISEVNKKAHLVTQTIQVTRLSGSWTCYLL